MPTSQQEVKSIPQENKMGTMPVNKLLISMSLPMMISMLVQAMYNIVDSIFVSFVGEDALTAVSLAFPVQNLMIAIATGTAVGINSLLSKSLGEKNFKEVNNAANNGVFLAVLSSLAFLIFGFFFSGTFFRVQTADPEILAYGTDYLAICSIFSFGLFGQITFQRLLQSTGRTVYNMVSQITGAVLNIILDPILIFGYFGLPAMGVAGAAWATIIGQLVAMVLALSFNLKFNPEIQLSFKGFRPKASTIRRIYSVGVPSIIMQAIGSVMTFGMNKILMGFTSTATAVFGVYFKLQSFIFMPVFGLNNGLVPIVAYNYGARRKERITAAIRLAITYAISIMVVGFLVFQIFPDQLLGFFNPSEELLAIGRPALRIISTAFLGAGFCIVSGTVFQALGQGVLSLLNSVCRQLVVLLPAAFLLSLSGNLNLVWLAFPIAEVFSIILSAIFLRRVYTNIINPITPFPEEASAQEA